MNSILQTRLANKIGVYKDEASNNIRNRIRHYQKIVKSIETSSKEDNVCYCQRQVSQYQFLVMGDEAYVNELEEAYRESQLLVEQYPNAKYLVELSDGIYRDLQEAKVHLKARKELLKVYSTQYKYLTGASQDGKQALLSFYRNKIEFKQNELKDLEIRLNNAKNQMKEYEQFLDSHK